jgi:hypothetical protein
MVFSRRVNFAPCLDSSIKCNALEIYVFSTPSTSRPSLTRRSTRTPIQAMASPFLWPVLVPSALRAPAPVN